VGAPGWIPGSDAGDLPARGWARLFSEVLWWRIAEGVQESVKEREAVPRGEGAEEVEDVVLGMAWGTAAQEVLGGEEIEAEGVEDVGEGDDAGVGDATGFDLGDEAGGDVGAAGQLAL
jgi:hypothetical protein